MIEIIPLKLKDLFDKSYLHQLDFIQESNDNCFITNIEIISRLLVIDLPINRRIAISKILSFLNYFDSISNDENIATIASKKISKHFTTKEYKKYLDILKEEKILSEIPNINGKFYTPKVESKRYRLIDRSNEELCIVIIDDTKPPIFEIQEGLVDNRFENTIKNLTFDYKNAICAEIDNFQNTTILVGQLRKRISKLLSLKVKRYIKSGNKVDRIYHSLSNLSKISRQFTNISFNNIDIVNCQPLLLCAYLTKNNYFIDLQYKKDCEDGIIYEKFMDQNDDRDEVKVELYKCIYFKFNEKHKLNVKFRELYPLTWESLKYISEENVSMASILQNFEASLFNTLVPKLSIHYYTLFDAIYFNNILDSKELVSSIKRFFTDLDIVVSLKLNNIKIK